MENRNAGKSVFPTFLKKDDVAAMFTEPEVNYCFSIIFKGEYQEPQYTQHTQRLADINIHRS